MFRFSGSISFLRRLRGSCRVRRASRAPLCADTLAATQKILSTKSAQLGKVPFSATGTAQRMLLLQRGRGCAAGSAHTVMQRNNAAAHGTGIFLPFILQKDGKPACENGAAVGQKTGVVARTIAFPDGSGAGRGTRCIQGNSARPFSRQQSQMAQARQ